MKLLLIGLFVAATNSGFTQRISVLLEQGRWTAAIGFAGVWAVCLGTLLVAALQPRPWVRGVWALVIAFGTVLGVGFRDLSGSDLGVLDFLSLWGARHDAGRALDFFRSEAWWLILILAAAVLVLAAAPVPTHPATRRWLSRFAWAPLLPLAGIAAILLVKQGGGAVALPTQFAPLSVAMASGLVLAMNPVPERAGVTWRPGPPRVRRIVLLIDESVRGDFLDWSPGNPQTPELARLKPRLTDFGPAVSGGVCSNYSNALLRFTAARGDLGRQLLLNPTIRDYAKVAGFRTVFVDAQAAFYRSPGKLANFMTPEEVRRIDRFHALSADGPDYELDYRLLALVARELRSDEPVFIYAVKNGAHFPYDRTYPAEERAFRPTMSETGQDGEALRINSYRNAVKWAVDGFFKRWFETVDMADTLVLYTSDHGEQFDPRYVPHCAIEAPSPQTALVPLLAIAGNDELHAQLEAAAQASQGPGTHFALVPTILELMGYAPEQVGDRFSDSLLRPRQQAPFFTSGDIFGLFSNKILTHPVAPEDVPSRAVQASASAFRAELGAR